MSEKALISETQEAVMVSEKGFILKQTHFLEPSINDVSSLVAELPRKHHHKKIESVNPRSFDPGFRIPAAYFISWLERMEALHEPIWKKAGIYEAIKVSTYNIVKNQSLLLSVSEKWCVETKSFIFPWGEATITLEDVMVLLGFSVLGSPVFVPLESLEMRESEKRLGLERVKCSGDGRVSKHVWFERFSGRGGVLEHEAFLVAWLSFFVFPGTFRPSVSAKVIPVAVRLARGERLALAPAVLAGLYRDLDLLVEGKVDIKSLLKLVQVWTWERFEGTRPSGKVREMGKHEPRISLWASLSQKDGRFCFDEFEWRPYTKTLKNWNPLQFYVDEAMCVTVEEGLFPSFVKCVRVSHLVGDGFVVSYFPHRVAMQFGFDQDLPGLVTRRGDNLTESEAWDDYNKSLNGLMLYIPSRLARGSVSKSYYLWWLKSFQEMDKEASESLAARKIVNHYDDADDDMTIASDGEKGKGDSSEKIGKRRRRYMVVETDESDSDEAPRKAQEKRQNCDDGTKESDYLHQEDGEKLCSEVMKEQMSEDCDDTPSKVQEKRQVSDGTKESLHQEDGEKQRLAKRSDFKKEVEEIDARIKQREVRIEEIALNLKARMAIAGKSLAMIRDWKTKGKKIKKEVSS